MPDLISFIGKRLYLDTNIIIYAVEGFPTYDRVLKALFTMIEDGRTRAFTSEITLAETFTVPIREGRTDLLAVYRGLLIDNGSIELLPIDRHILIESAVVRAHSGVKPIDAIHVASASVARCDFFISDDRRLNTAPLPKIALDEIAVA